MNIDISVIVPVYNEEKTLLLLLDKLFVSLEKSGLMYQVIAVDDGSSDKSINILLDYQKQINNLENFKVILHEKNQGKGGAIHTGLKESVGEYTIIQDADLEYDPDDIIRLYKYAKNENLPVVYGSRNKENNKRGTFFFYWGGKLVTYVANFLFGQKMTDEATCYKLIATKKLQSMPLCEKGFAFCPEVTSYLAKDGIKIPEIAISYNPRSKDEGKKINWRDGVVAIWTLLRLRFPNILLHLQAFLVFIFVLFLFTLTWQMNFGGYEQETADSAMSLFSGEYAAKRAGISSLFLYVPFILIFKLFAFSNFTFLSIVPIFYSALTVWLLVYVVWYLRKKLYPSLLLPVVIATGSIIWPYSNLGMEYQQTFYLTLLLLMLLKWKNNRVSLWWVAITFALLVTAKSYAIIFALPVLLFVFLVDRQNKSLTKKDYLKHFIILFLPAFVAILSVLLAQYLVYGAWTGVYSLSHEFQIWTWWEGFYGIFFSIGKSIFLFSPWLILTLFVWKRFWREQKETAVFLLVSFLLLLLITAPFSYWTDETWSVRKLVAIMVLLHLPLIYFFEEKVMSVSKKIVFLFLFVFSFYVQFLGASYYYGKQLDILREANLDTLQNMRFVPQLGHIQVNHQLFSSYFTKEESLLVYSEQTWFRWLRGEKDVSFYDVKMNIEKYSKVDIAWFQPDKSNLKFVFYSLLVLEILLSIFLLWWYSLVRRK
ncbi:MAG: glycosyltransferase family 2 protein [Candidatus Magasanikbacteria bacterium]